MANLGEIVGSRIRASVFRLLFVDPDIELHVREIQRRSGFNDRGLRQELEKLRHLEIVVPRRDGNRLYYRAKRDSPLYDRVGGATDSEADELIRFGSELRSEVIRWLQANHPELI
jgi:hypothetical protein